MEYAIIAAGEGSRLKAEGFDAPKPMVTLFGKPLIERLLAVFANNGATKIHIIINEYSPQVQAYLAESKYHNLINLVQKTTPSSLHSFYEIAPHIAADKVCLTTVDAVFNEAEFAGYVRAFENNSADAFMAVTPFVDDESPLYVQVDELLNVTGYKNEHSGECTLVSGGIYCLRKPAFSLVKEAVENGMERMRNFQKMLVEKGLNVQAHVFSKIVDIDHVSDIATAEEWLTQLATQSIT